MADEIEDYWEGIRPQRPRDPVPVVPKVVEYQDPVNFTNEDLEIGLRAMSRLRTELATRSTQEDAEYLKRTIRQGLGIPEGTTLMTPADAIQSWAATAGAREAVGLQQYLNNALTNLIRAFGALGYRCEASINNSRLRVALPNQAPGNWLVNQLPSGGVELILDLQR